MLACDGCGIRNAKSPAHIESALPRRKPGLALGPTQAHQRARGKGETPGSMVLAQICDRFGSQQACLVEAAIGVFRPMERDRNNEHFARSFGRKLHDRTGQHLTEFRCNRAQAVVLECMDQIAHAALVGGPRNRLHKWRRSEAAGAAEVGGLQIGICEDLPRKNVERVAAPLTQGVALNGDFRPAGITNWRGGELRQGRSTEGATRGEDGANYRIDGTSEHAGYRAPSGNL